MGVSGAAALDPCAVNCSEQIEEHLTADPVNCKNYYICFDNESHSVYPFDCDGNMFFDITTNTCRENNFTCTPECEKCSFNCSEPVLGKIASSVDCGIYYTCDTGAVTVCPAERPFFDGDVCQTDETKCCTCKSFCTQSDVDNHAMIPDYHNCTNYYLCMQTGIPGDVTYGHCPLGNFNSETGQCDEEAPCVEPCR